MKKKSFKKKFIRILVLVLNVLVLVLGTPKPALYLAKLAFRWWYFAEKCTKMHQLYSKVVVFCRKMLKNVL